MSNTSNHQHWAFKRTEEIAPYGTPPAEMRKLWAAYIAEKEQPPVDEVTLEARAIVASSYRAVGEYAFADKVEDGNHDDDTRMSLIVHTLRRGIELGKAGQ